MRRRQLLATAAVGIAATAAGCVTSALESDDRESTTETETRGGEIVVSTGGEATAEPDAASLGVGVEARGDSAEDVTEELAEQAEDLREALDALGIPEERLEEGRYRVHPERRRDGDPDGYEGSHSFELTVDEVDRVGEIVDALVAAGADDVGRITFGLREETRDELREAAIDDALANADDEANHIADNRGVSITGTASVETGDVRMDPVQLEANDAVEAEDAERPPTEIGADPVSVTASVTVAYRFE